MKHALYFLAGSLFNVAFIFFSPGKPALLVVLGALLGLGSVAAVVRLLGIARTIRVLNALSSEAGAVEKSRSERAGMRNEAKAKYGVSGKDKNPWGYVRPSAKQRYRDFANDLEWMKEEAQSAGRVQ